MDELDREIARDQIAQKQPWTTADYEAVVRTALAAVRRMTPITLESGTFYAGLDGPLFWDLLSALDRDPHPRPGPGRPAKR